jgi:hypothetical protein
MIQKRFASLFLSLVLLAVFGLALTACGTLEVGIERTATPSPSPTASPTGASAVPTATSPTGTLVVSTATYTPLPPPSPTATPTPGVPGWSTFSSPAYGVSLQYPAGWQSVPGYSDPEAGETKFAGPDGFFQISAMSGDGLDQVVASEAEHHLRPYGSQPVIENVRVAGQEARLILPSADQPAAMAGQAELIVRYPEPVTLAGYDYEFFVLWADQDHIRAIAQTVQFLAAAEPMPPVSWDSLPPGLVYTTQQGLWLVKADERPVLLYNDPQAVLSPHGTRLLTYDADQRDLWLLDLAEGTIRRLTDTPDRSECCFRWWPERPDLVLFQSTSGDAEAGPGAAGYLTTIGTDGQGYHVLDPEHAFGPGSFAPSPDGQTIAYGDGRMAWLYREGGAEVLNPVEHGLNGYEGVYLAQPSWSPDGKRLAWIAKGDVAADGRSSWTGVALFDLQARTAQVLHPYASQGVGWPAAPAWSPDGKWLAFSDSSPSDEAGLWVVRLDGQQQEHHLGLGGQPAWSPDGKWLAFQSLAADGPPAYVAVEMGAWALRPLDVPVDRYGQLVDWIRLDAGGGASWSTGDGASPHPG